ncbi:protein ClpV1 (plasmid) [Burkholderia sp. SFA1]|uniref:type VI secretion system ATPase TssH n=1 Tax=unclassified Caballeronia TaxID=2646786 RepID=UPI001F2546EA|nr:MULTISPECIES: type VI secretion system ATPase TssH [unclassified Caballeronia]MCE4545731.1 type VI secretion system ATPase TssH [Caballeronia sp. PC1]MCE4572147.1 type VI secretion system ATPase TssH [Caballeronia sp. CLC5]BBQ01081.1 protein ClpV1 [Burkholderia sp. SFA1]
MAEINRVALFGKLDRLGYKTVESATIYCKMRGNPYVELAHWLMQILETPRSDLQRIVAHYRVDAAALARELTASLDRLPRGATSISDISEHITDAIERGWVYGTLLYGANKVRTGHLLVGMLKTPRLRHVLVGISRQFERIGTEDLSDNFARIVADSAEEGEDEALAPPSPSNDDAAPASMGRQEALRKYASDLTDRARQGALDPVTGRDEEIRQLIDILMRRRQNNPLLTGEAGVGKTAVVEGFAQRLVRGDVPPSLREVALWSLDLGLLQAGASMKGEFEQRLRQVVEDVQASPKPVILFIDEVHTIVGAGGTAGTGDAANLLKPALARGDLRTIGATTWSEYKKHIEKDPALTRRFQVVQVHEPDEAKAVRMLRGVAAVLEGHHRVQLLDEAIEAAVRLSHRYIPARQLPDKAVSLLDTACARVAVSQHATPPQVEDCQRRIESLDVEAQIVAREANVGVDVGTRAAEVESSLARERDALGGLEARWAEEKRVVDELLALRASLREQGEAVDAPPPSRDERLARLAELKARLADLQGDAPLILPSVDAGVVAGVVADWTGIPVGRMLKNELAAVLNLADALDRRVIGQRHALEMIAKRIQTSRARLDNPDKPIGVFMLAGTSGVGKTETALALAETLYGGEQNVITINMSEFQEAHTVSTLKGAPPGYVGYGEGGILTEAVRRRPYSVVLLDEVEKAHPDVHEIFFQVFDKGWMEDGEGRYIDFKNTIILLTSNVGSDLIMSMCRDPAGLPAPERLAAALRRPLLDVFPAALLGRLVTVPYYPLSDAMMADIVRLQLDRIRRRVAENHGIPFDYDDDAVRLIVSRCTEAESGGRVIDALLTNTVLPRISTEYLTRLTEGGALERIRLSASANDFVYAFD